ncbi:MAG: helix-turn-helix transcriptional regulator [Acutalibacteraceae bacterium]
MPKKGYQKLKLLYILDILKKYSDEEHPLNSKDILDKLSEYSVPAERKAIYDDIAQLEAYGCDIIKTSAPKTGWFIGNREFEVPEIYLLADAVRTAKFISAKKTRELISKLYSMLSIHQAKSREDGVYFAATEKSGNEEIYYNIDKLNRAIIEKKQVKIEYLSRSFDQDRTIKRERKEMTINPYALCWQDDHYYLIGNHPKYDNLIHLRLDRIALVEMTENKARSFTEVSEYTDFFDTADYTNKLFGMYGGELCEVELCCSKKITEQVIDRFGEDIFIKNVTEDEFNFTVKAAVSDALVTWIINYGENLKVLRPDNLREMVKQRAQSVLNAYNDGEIVI